MNPVETINYLSSIYKYKIITVNEHLEIWFEVEPDNWKLFYEVEIHRTPPPVVESEFDGRGTA